MILAIIFLWIYFNVGIIANLSAYNSGKLQKHDDLLYHMTMLVIWPIIWAMPDSI